MRPLRRSMLFVPGSEPRRLEKALSVPADSLIFDLEDAVAPEQKTKARALVVDALQSIDSQTEIVVRINPEGSPWFNEDLAAISAAGVDSIMLPKAEQAAAVAALAKQLPAGMQLIPLIESAQGVLNAAAIAACGNNIGALCFGHADYCLDLGLANNDSLQTIVLHARCQTVLAAKAAQVSPIDNVCLAIKDADLLSQDISTGLQLGMEGKLCIHPLQVEAANRLYTPSEEQISWAQTVVTAAADAEAQGKGVFALNNKMIDAPVIQAQQQVLNRAQAAGLIN